MERSDRLAPSQGLEIALHIECDAVTDMRLGSDSVDGLLHFAMPTVASFDGIGGRWEQ